jgi:hypothetical protein
MVRADRMNNLDAAEDQRTQQLPDDETNQAELDALASGGLCPTTDEEDGE